MSPVLVMVPNDREQRRYRRTAREAAVVEMNATKNPVWQEMRESRASSFGDNTAFAMPGLWRPLAPQSRKTGPRVRSTIKAELLHHPQHRLRITELLSRALLKPAHARLVDTKRLGHLSLGLAARTALQHSTLTIRDHKVAPSVVIATPRVVTRERSRSARSSKKGVLRMRDRIAPCS